MHVRELKVGDCFEFTPKSFPDNRGLFVAPFQDGPVREAIGHPLTLAQVNHSVSARGVIRGMHYADVPPGQAKFVYCSAGALLDVVVDVRVGSPSYGEWDSARLDSDEYRAVYVAEGIAHGFVALTDDTVMTYLCSTGYNPGAERGFTPYEKSLALPWPADIEPILSAKDESAPPLAELAAAGLLPSYAACQEHYAALRVG